MFVCLEIRDRTKVESYRHSFTASLPLSGKIGFSGERGIALQYGFAVAGIRDEPKRKNGPITSDAKN